MTIAVAVGKDKIESIIAAARGGYFNHLVTDPVDRERHPRQPGPIAERRREMTGSPRLDGKRALITGATKGIGADIARTFAAAGRRAGAERS